MVQKLGPVLHSKLAALISTITGKLITRPIGHIVPILRRTCQDKLTCRLLDLHFNWNTTKQTSCQRVWKSFHKEQNYFLLMMPIYVIMQKTLWQQCRMEILHPPIPFEDCSVDERYTAVCLLWWCADTDDTLIAEIAWLTTNVPFHC